MKNLITITAIAIAIIFTSCRTDKKTSINNTHARNTATIEHDGSSFDKAIIINENTESKGVAYEYSWLRNHYPGYKFNEQTLSINKKIHYDVINIITSNEEKKTIYFDISKFYGNL